MLSYAKKKKIPQQPDKILTGEDEEEGGEQGEDRDLSAGHLERERGRERKTNT